MKRNFLYAQLQNDDTNERQSKRQKRNGSSSPQFRRPRLRYDWIDQSSAFGMSVVFNEHRVRLNPSYYSKESLILSNCSVISLASGYLRSFGVNPINISKVVSRYIQPHSKLERQCEVIFIPNPITRFKFDHDDWCTVLFKPELSKLGQSGKTLKITLISTDCNVTWAQKIGYWFEIGIIGVPKHLNQQFFKMYLKSGCEYDFNEFMYDVKNKSDKNKQLIQSLDIKYLFFFRGFNYQGVKYNYAEFMKYCKNILTSKEKYDWHDAVIRLYGSYWDDYAYFGDKVPKRVQNIDQEKNVAYCGLERNDSIDICVESSPMDSNRATLCFMKNKNVHQIFGHGSIHSGFEQGKVNLNFEENYYYAGLSTSRCNCKDSQGFRFAVSLSD